MGSKYPILTPKEIVRVLEKFGFYFVSQNHDEVARGTFKSILSMSGISLEKFLDKLN